MSDLTLSQRATIERLLVAHANNFPNGQAPQLDLCQVQPFAADGSNRKFFRIVVDSQFSCIVIIPEKLDSFDLKEAYAAWMIGNHLHRCEVPVPKLFAFDRETGILINEDLGSTQLFNLAQATDRENAGQIQQLRHVYMQVIECLVHMQVTGARDFSSEWCCDTSVYSKELMLERESGYFLRAFWQGIGNKEIPSGITSEFEELARYAASIPNEYFLFRDFQSRNIMVRDDRVYFIDYQGGRKGPLGYDLASLLIDPYVMLPEDMRMDLFQYYMEKLDAAGHLPKDFMRQYTALFLQRNLQIIGAFSFLSSVRGKPFFRQYILPSLVTLQQMLNKQQYFFMPVVQSVVDTALSEMFFKEQP